MPEGNEPLDYHNPRTPGERQTGRNFGGGVIVGVFAAVTPYAMGYAGVPGNVVLGAAAALFIGALVWALVVALGKRRPGFAPGVLATLGVALLVSCGLCFYAIQHI